MKVVLDTNVLIAAFLTRGVCHELFEHCTRYHEVLTSEFILDEFEKHLIHKFKFSEKDTRAALQLVKAKSTMVSLPKTVQEFCRDSDDDWILATAILGHSRYLITGDKDLLVLKQINKISIIKPNEFWHLENK